MIPPVRRSPCVLVSGAPRRRQEGRARRAALDTPVSPEVCEHSEPLPFDEQGVPQLAGDVVGRRRCCRAGLLRRGGAAGRWPGRRSRPGRQRPMRRRTVPARPARPARTGAGRQVRSAGRRVGRSGPTSGKAGGWDGPRVRRAGRRADHAAQSGTDGAGSSGRGMAASQAVRRGRARRGPRSSQIGSALCGRLGAVRPSARRAAMRRGGSPASRWQGHGSVGSVAAPVPLGSWRAPGSAAAASARRASVPVVRRTAGRVADGSARSGATASGSATGSALSNRGPWDTSRSDRSGVRPGGSATPSDRALPSSASATVQESTRWATSRAGPAPARPDRPARQVHVAVDRGRAGVERSARPAYTA